MSWAELIFGSRSAWRSCSRQSNGSCGSNLGTDGSKWKNIFLEAQQRKLIANPKEKAALTLAMNIPKKLPNPKQCALLNQLLERLKSEGVPLPSSMTFNL